MLYLVAALVVKGVVGGVKEGARGGRVGDEVPCVGAGGCLCRQLGVSWGVPFGGLSSGPRGVRLPTVCS